MSLPAKSAHEFHPLEAKMALESEQILIRNLKNEMRGIRQQIDREKNPRKQTEMIKAYRKMSKALSG